MPTTVIRQSIDSIELDKTGFAPRSKDLAGVPSLHTIGGQIVFADRKNTPADSKIESHFKCGSVSVFTYRGDPSIGDDRSLYITIQAHDEPQGNKLVRALKGESGNAMVTLRVGILDKPVSSEMSELLGVPPNYSKILEAEKVNKISISVGQVLDALKKLEDPESSFATKIFGKNNNKLNEGRLGQILKDAGIGQETTVVDFRSCTLTTPRDASLP
jgi:hypothetical protein